MSCSLTLLNSSGFKEKQQLYSCVMVLLDKLFGWGLLN